MTNPYTFTDNPMVSGVSVCNTDIVNDNIMALKWMHDHITFRQIGEIVTSTIPLTDAGLHLLDGALISGSGSYADFVTYISGLVSTYPDLFATESNWQSTVTQYGVCGKFVYDSVNNTVRLPKITGFVEGASGIAMLGDLTEAGLPNITGQIGREGTGYMFTSSLTNGAFRVGSSDSNNGFNVAGSYHLPTSATFNASRSSSIYGNSSTVQPQTIKVLYYIVIAASIKTDIQVNIDNIATDLNGKADVDLINVNNTGTSKITHYASPSETAKDLTLGASGATYTADADGYIIISKGATASGQYVQLYTTNYSVLSRSTSSSETVICLLPISKGQGFKTYFTAAGTTNYFRLIYLNGNIHESV